AINEGKSGLVSHGYYTPIVVLMSENRALLEEQARYVRKGIKGQGFSARIEEANATNAWLGSLPGMAYPNVRRPIIHTLNLADLLPLSGIWEGLSENPCSLYPAGSPPLMQVITTGSTPLNLNLHVQQTAHTLVFGPTGSGKSVLLGILAAQAQRYQSRPRPDGSVAPALIAAFDKGGSMYTLCKASGGQHYAIGSDDDAEVVLCPLADIDTESGMKWAKGWIGTCYELQTGKELTPVQKNEVHLAINSLKDKPKKFRTLTDFNNTVQDNQVRDAIQHYTNRGAMGSLLDGKEDSLQDSNFTVFEIDELMNMGSANGIPVLLCLFRRFEKTLTGQPAFLFLDEAWIMLGHPVFREKIREWLKEMRKKNCAVILATQSLSDAVRSGIMDTIVEQCPTKIFLPNHEADLHGTPENPGPAEYYAMFGLEEKEIQQIKKARYKQDYYLRSPGGQRWFELAVGPLAMRFIGVSDKDSIRDVKACEKAHGKNWPIYWLKQGGVDYAKYVQ
ncbi:MAG TPA: conjugal transfer protein TrbE, partial [Anaerolineales bacterium]